jgi:integrase/recombinase XerD
MGDIQIINLFGNHQRVRGFSRRTIERRAWSLSLWVQYLHVHESGLGDAGELVLTSFLARWPSAQSRYSVRSDIHQLYVWANRSGVLRCADPTDGLEPPKLRRRAASPIAALDVRRLIDSTNGRDRLIVMLAAYAGLRISEISALRGEDVDLEGRQLVVRCGKGGSDDVVPLADELADELRLWPRGGRLVPIKGASVGGRIRALYRRLGVSGRPHDLRHSFGTQAARRTNGNLVQVAKLMRHSEVATSQRYVEWRALGHEIVTGLYDGAA